VSSLKVHSDARSIRHTESQRAWGLERPCLGLALGGTHSTPQLERNRRWVSLAESQGLHSVWLPEMHFAPGACSAPLVELAGYAATTERLRFGTTSLLLPLHPPEEIAAEISALDQLSRGRLLIGLGRGFNKKMLEAFDVPPAEKRNRFDAALDRIFTLWAEANERSGPLATYQKPHPPLAVAAFGPKGLAQAAGHGLPYLASPVETLDQIADNQQRHRAQLPDPSQRVLSLVMRTVFVSDDASELAEARESLAMEMTGRREGMPKAIQNALDAPLDERAVIGTASEVTERLASDRARLSIDLLIVRPQFARMDSAKLERSLIRLAEEVWPAVSALAASSAAS
jgi:alkanesulfonate monooxygenase SsuD/methylene tetrahydromethanopterin reductase-like flavin-dependent oxidoreductase (luciferase family)